VAEDPHQQQQQQRHSSRPGLQLPDGMASTPTAAGGDTVHVHPGAVSLGVSAAAGSSRQLAPSQVPHVVQPPGDTAAALPEGAAMDVGSEGSFVPYSPRSTPLWRHVPPAWAAAAPLQPTPAVAAAGLSESSRQAADAVGVLPDGEVCSTSGALAAAGGAAGEEAAAQEQLQHLQFEVQHLIR
jgi:hypothetical protein